MIVNLFYEASTRTRTSFEIAAKRLGADAVSITRFRLQRHQGRIAGGHAEHAGGHAAGRHRDAPFGFRRAAFSGAAPAHAHHQRGRRHARASHPGAAGRAHHSGPARRAGRAARGHHRRYRAQPRGALQRAPALEIRRGDRAVRAGVAAAGGTGAAGAGRAAHHRHPRGHPRRGRDHDAARATRAAARSVLSRRANTSGSTACGWSTWTWPSRTPS